jgi:sugar phosphate isomerase/epimerase
MIELTRRDFLRTSAVVAGGMLLAAPSLHSAPARKMKLSLSPGAIGVKAGPREAVALALAHGFEAVEPATDFLMGLGDADLKAFRESMKGLAWGVAGLPVEFRGDVAKFESTLEGLPRRAAALKRAGVDRVSTWLSPSHNDLPREQNFERHVKRLGAAAKVLREHGMRLGLEYVGTPSLRKGRAHPFIYNMKQTRELIDAIGTGNIGLVLDSWHWWTAGESEADLLSLRNSDVVSVDLNDAPAGIPVDQQQDGQRELPSATGVIPVATFVNALQRIGFDGPVRAEPFNRRLNEMDDQPACAATIVALKKAMALLA